MGRKSKFNTLVEDLEHGKLSSYNIYNLDIDVDEQATAKYYRENLHDKIDTPQLLHKMFFDIEVYSHNTGIFPDPMIAKEPISANTMFFTVNKTYYCYLYPPEGFNMTEEEVEAYFLKKSKEPTVIGYNSDGTEKYGVYLEKDDKIKVKFFKDSGLLAVSSFEKVKELDPSIISSFNGHTFDMPYMYNFLMNYFNGDHTKVAKVMSRYGKVNLINSRDRAGKTFKEVKIFEFPHVDMLYAYLPRDDGGLGLGSKQKSYTLNFIAERELGLTKYEYASKGLTLDQFYEKDFLNYALYNLWDVALTVQLDRKLALIDLYNMQRRKMNTALSPALRGASPLYDTYIFSDISKNKKYIRYGISTENGFSISEEYIRKLYKPKSKIKWDIESLDQREVSKVLTRYPGALVKSPSPGIYTGIMCDMDADRMYPAQIIQNNIGIETFVGRIISSNMMNSFNTFRRLFGKTKEIPQNLYTGYLNLCDNYVESEDLVQKNKIKQELYIVLTYLFTKCLESGYTLDELFQPKTLKQYIISRTYFNSLLELLEDIHPDQKEYNPQIYKYLVNNEDLDEDLYIIEDYNNPTWHIRKLPGRDFPKYLKENKYGVTLTGTLFKNHENQESMFAKILNELYALRKQYKAQMYKYPEGSFDFIEFNRKQLTTKVLMNTLYGILGLSTFRYSNKWLVKSTTGQGRYTLKVAQYLCETYLRNIHKENEKKINN